MKHKNLSFNRRMRFALLGVIGAWRKEASLRFQSLAALALLIFCVVVQPPLIWCALFTGMAGLVISLEMVNSAVESILDKIHPEHHEAIGFAKDCLAGAVLIASVTSVVVFGCYWVSHF